MFSSPAMPFMMFHGPDIITTPSITSPAACIPYTWKSRMQASKMLIDRISGGNSSTHRFAAIFSL